MAAVEADVRAALSGVEEPELRRSVADLGMVRDVARQGQAGHGQPGAAAPGRRHPRRAAAGGWSTAAGAVPGVDRVEVDLRDMDETELRAVADILKGVTPNPLAGARRRRGTAARPSRGVNPFTDTRTRVLAIASGKGGVGKSSVTTNLSIALAQRGQRVAAVDADVWGFSMPRMLGISSPPGLIDDVIVPPEALRRPADLDGLLRARRPGGDLARPDVAQGARAVPHRRLLGRDRLPHHRHAARHRRRAAVDLAVPPARRGDRRHHAATGGAAGRAARRGDGREGRPRRDRRDREHVVVHG